MGASLASMKIKFVKEDFKSLFPVATTVKDVAEKLKIPLPTIYRLISQGKVYRGQKRLRPYVLGGIKYRYILYSNHIVKINNALRIYNKWSILAKMLAAKRKISFKSAKREVRRYKKKGLSYKKISDRIDLINGNKA